MNRSVSIFFAAALLALLGVLTLGVLVESTRSSFTPAWLPFVMTPAAAVALLASLGLVIGTTWALEAGVAASSLVGTLSAVSIFNEPGFFKMGPIVGLFFAAATLAALTLVAPQPHRRYSG